MRIAQITGEYPPDQGGVGDFTHELSRALVGLGHAVHVITSIVDGASAFVHQDGLTVRRVVHDWGWRAMGRIEAELVAIGPDVVNVQYQAAAYGMHPAINLFPWRQRRRSGPPTVVTFHDLRVPYLFPKAGPLRWQAVLALARWSQGAIVTNRPDERTLAGQGGSLAPIERIPIGSNIAPCLPPDYDRRGWRRRWQVDDDDLLLGYFGFLNERKGGEALIETLAGLVRRDVSARLLLIGGQVGTSDPTNQAYAERVDALIAQHGLAGRVKRTGFVAPTEVSACLSAVNVCVLPYTEGVCLRHGSFHACLAHGCPIVTTQPTVETPDLRTEEHVLLVPRGDVAALVAATLRLWRQPALRQRLAAGARDLAQTFTWERIAARTARFFEEVAA
jgi:glycosyltransferase involved in cell wall biosynthesis